MSNFKVGDVVDYIGKLQRSKGRPLVVTSVRGDGGAVTVKPDDCWFLTCAPKYLTPHVWQPGEPVVVREDARPVENPIYGVPLTPIRDQFGPVWKLVKRERYDGQWWYAHRHDGRERTPLHESWLHPAPEEAAKHTHCVGCGTDLRAVARMRLDVCDDCDRALRVGEKRNDAGRDALTEINTFACGDPHGEPALPHVGWTGTVREAVEMFRDVLPGWRLTWSYGFRGIDDMMPGGRVVSVDGGRDWVTISTDNDGVLDGAAFIHLTAPPEKVAERPTEPPDDEHAAGSAEEKERARHIPTKRPVSVRLSRWTTEGQEFTKAICAPCCTDEAEEFRLRDGVAHVPECAGDCEPATDDANPCGVPEGEHVHETLAGDDVLLDACRSCGKPLRECVRDGDAVNVSGAQMDTWRDLVHECDAERATAWDANRRPVSALAALPDARPGKPVRTRPVPVLDLETLADLT